MHRHPLPARSRARRRSLLCAVTATLTLAGAAGATAAPTVANLSAAPVDPSSGAHSPLTIAFGVDGLGATGTGGDDVRSLQLDLPPGLVGNPQATGGTCPRAQLQADACPAATQIGTSTVVADVRLSDLVGLGEQSIPGSIYNVAVAGGEAARLGIVLRPALGLPKVVLESPVVLRPADGGLTSTVDDIPRTTSTPAGTAQLRIVRMAMTLAASAPSGTAFLTNPTACGPATTRVAIGTYAGGRASAAAGFTAAGCERLPFGPTLSATVGSRRSELRPGAHPAVTVVVAQRAGEANTRRVSVELPKGLGANLTGLGNACALERYEAGTCPAAAVVGSASAASPLLAGPLSGLVTLVAIKGQLPQLRVALRGALSVDLIGRVSLTRANRLVNTFDGIVDVPLSRFVLTVNAGPASPLVVQSDLCTPGTASLQGSFAAHSGRQASASATARTTGCGRVRAPRSSARIGRLASGRPALRLRVTSTDRVLTLVRVRLPKGLSFARGARALADAHVIGGGSPVTVALRAGRLVLTLPRNGATSLEVELSAGAIRVSPRLRSTHPRRVTLGVDAGRPGVKTVRSKVRALTVRRP